MGMRLVSQTRIRLPHSAATHLWGYLRDSVQEEVQLREQDFGNFQDDNLPNFWDERLRFGRFFYRFPNGESGCDVYDRITIYQDHVIRDMEQGRFPEGAALVLVTHGLTLRIFLMRWMGVDVGGFAEYWRMGVDVGGFAEYGRVGVDVGGCAEYGRVGVDVGGFAEYGWVVVAAGCAEWRMGDAVWECWLTQSVYNPPNATPVLLERVDITEEDAKGKFKHTKSKYRIAEEAQQLCSGVTDAMCITGNSDIIESGDDWCELY
eukprot:gene2064-2760_t